MERPCIGKDTLWNKNSLATRLLIHTTGSLLQRPAVKWVTRHGSPTTFTRLSRPSFSSVIRLASSHLFHRTQTGRRVQIANHRRIRFRDVHPSPYLWIIGDFYREIYSKNHNLVHRTPAAVRSTAKKKKPPHLVTCNRRRRRGTQHSSHCLEAPQHLSHRSARGSVSIKSQPKGNPT